VRDAVSPEIARLRDLVARLDRPGSTAEITALADTVAAYSTGVVRKTSHELRGEEPPLLTGQVEREGPVRAASVLTSYARASQPIFIPMGLITVRAISVWISQEDAAILVGLVGLLAVTSLAALCRNLLDRMLRRPSWSEFLLSSMLIAAASGALTAIFAWARGGASGPSFIPPAMIFMFVLVVLVAARLVAGLELRAVRQAEELSRVNVELEAANGQLRDEVHVVRDQLAGLLHGPVQGRLAAASMALRMYVADLESGREADLATTVRTTTTLLDRAQADIEQIGRPEELPAGTVEQGVRRIASTWSGLLDIEFVHSDPWPRTPEFVAGCVDVIAELITNASRHGDARRVLVSYTGLDSVRVTIVAVDDGCGPASHVTEGQGLAGVRRWSGTWHMERDPGGGTRVRVDVQQPA